MRHLTILIAATIISSTSSLQSWFMRGNGNHHRGSRSDASGPGTSPSERYNVKTNDRVVSQVVVDSDLNIYFGSADSFVYAIRPDGRLMWKFKTHGAVISTPAIRNDAIYVGSWDHHIYSIEKDTGKLRWKFETKNVVSSSPAISSNGIVLVGSGDSHLYALNSKNGELLWSHKTNNAVYSSPAISSDDRVVYFGSWDGRIRAVDTYSGKLIWEHVAQGAIDSSPALSSDEETLYVGVWSGNVLAIDIRTGTRKWTFRCGNEGVVASPSIMSDGTIVIGSWNRKIHAIDPSTGGSIWELDVGEIVESTAAIDSQDNVYVGVWGGHILGIRGHDGEIMWKEMYGETSISSGITLLRDGTIAFGSDDGRVRFLSETNVVTPPKTSSMAPPDSSSSCALDSNPEESCTQQQQQQHTPSKGWTEFRGGYKHAYSSQSKLEGPERLHILWTIRRGMSFSASPVFDENERRIFIGNADGLLYAFEFDSSTNKVVEVWKVDTGGTIVSTASVRDGRVFVGSWDQCIRALDASSGELIWTFHTNEPVSSSPTIHPDGTHLVVGSGDGRVLSIRTDTGTLRWEFQAQGSVHSSPTISHDGNVVVVASWDHNVYALSSLDGSMIWSHETKDKIDSSILILNSNVVVAGWDGFVTCLSLDSGDVQWTTNTKSGGVVSSPTLSSELDLILVGTWNAEILALDVITGSIMWRTSTDSEIEASVVSTSNGIAYVGTVSGTLYSFREKTGQILETFSFRETRPGVSSPVNVPAGIASSALVGSEKRVYVALTDGRLVALYDPSSQYGTLSALCDVSKCARPMLSMDISHSGRSLQAVPKYNVKDPSIKKTMNVILWSRKFESSIVSSPSVGAFNALYVATYSGVLYVLDVITGHTRWRFETTNSPIVSSPAISDDGTIYFGSWNKKVYAVDAFGNAKWEYETDGAISASPLLLTKNEETHIYIGSGDGVMYKYDTSGRTVWKCKIGQAIYSSAAASRDGETLYVGSNDNHLYAIDTSSGKIIWRQMLQGKIEASPAVGSDGTIFVADFGGVVTAVSRHGSIEWAYETPGHVGIVSSPTLDLEDTVYIGSKTKQVFAIRRDGTLKWSYLLEENVDSTLTLDRDGKLVFGGSKGGVHVLDSISGRAIWSFNLRSAIFSTPVLCGHNMMVVTTESGNVFAIAGHNDDEEN